MVCPQVLLLGRAVHARGDGSDVVRRLVDGPGTRSVVGVPDSRLRPPGTTPPLADGVSRCAVLSPTALCPQVFRDGVRLVTRIGDADKTVDGVSYKCISDEPLPPSHPSPLNGTTVWSYTWCAEPSRPPFLWCLRSGFSCCRRAGITRGDFVRVGKEEALFTNHYVLCRARFTCRDSSARRGQRRGPRAASCRWCCAPRRHSAAH